MSEHIADIVSREDLRLHNDDELRKLVARYEIDDRFDPYRYVPPGPVAQTFILGQDLTAVIMGPLGGGKTTACAFKRIVAAQRAPVAWHPEDHRPTRMCRWIVLRDTFRSVEKTVLESWKQWFPKGYPGSSWAGGNDRPVTHVLRFLGRDGVRIEAITEFAGLGELNVGDLMKGREYSGAWLNEIDTHAPGALDDMEQRVGRYPMVDILLRPEELLELGRQLGHPIVSGPRQRSVIGDMNAPTLDNWTYAALVSDRKPDRAFYQQPSGRSADAENRFNLEPDYYERIIRNQEEHFVRRMVDNKFGYSRAGKPVHPSFDHPRHVAGSEILFRPELDLHIGLDISTGGLSPASVLAQATARISFIDELFVDQGCGPARFGEALKVLMQTRYSNVPKNRVKLYPDPAAIGGADKEQGELDAIETIAAILGIPWTLPFDGSNQLSMRLGAVDTELRGYQEANTSLLISPRCKLYIAGIAGLYRFKKKPLNTSDEYEDTPEKKHPWSDIQDAGQYLIGGIRGRMALRRAAADQDGTAGTSWRSQGRSGSINRGSFDVHKVGR